MKNNIPHDHDDKGSSLRKKIEALNPIHFVISFVISLGNLILSGPPFLYIIAGIILSYHLFTSKRKKSSGSDFSSDSVLDGERSQVKIRDDFETSFIEDSREDESELLEEEVKEPEYDDGTRRIALAVFVLLIIYLPIHLYAKHESMWLELLDKFSFKKYKQAVVFKQSESAPGVIESANNLFKLTDFMTENDTTSTHIYNEYEAIIFKFLPLGIRPAWVSVEVETEGIFYNTTVDVSGLPSIDFDTLGASKPHLLRQRPNLPDAINARIDKQARYINNYLNAILQYCIGDTNKAKEIFDSLLTITKDETEFIDVRLLSFYFIGCIHSQLGEHDEAIDNFRKADELVGKFLGDNRKDLQKRLHSQIIASQNYNVQQESSPDSLTQTGNVSAVSLSSPTTPLPSSTRNNLPEDSDVKKSVSNAKSSLVVRDSVATEEKNATIKGNDIFDEGLTVVGELREFSKIKDGKIKKGILQTAENNKIITLFEAQFDSTVIYNKHFIGIQNGRQSLFYKKTRVLPDDYAKISYSHGYFITNDIRDTVYIDEKQDTVESEFQVSSIVGVELEKFRILVESRNARITFHTTFAGYHYFVTENKGGHEGLYRINGLSSKEIISPVYDSIISVSDIGIIVKKGSFYELKDINGVDIKFGQADSLLTIRELKNSEDKTWAYANDKEMYFLFDPITKQCLSSFSSIDLVQGHEENTLIQLYYESDGHLAATKTIQYDSIKHIEGIGYIVAKNDLFGLMTYDNRLPIKLKCRKGEISIYQGNAIFRYGGAGRWKAYSLEKQELLRKKFRSDKDAKAYIELI
ncbi:MAG: hypothetical protein ACFB15_18870 [Cyclobacteriaceae bacterium]